jgi:uncharacterized protein
MDTNITVPGVYVKEIPTLPPSVAPVATAIPAFIGYTEIAQSATDPNLTMKPTRITSMPEYQLLFGQADPETAIVVTMTTATDGSVAVTAALDEAKRTKHLMWYALQLYFDNGGGPCYICSVGNYAAGMTATDLKNGLAAVNLVDEPTLIVYPEAQTLDLVSCVGLYQFTLGQCSALKDRFVIMDLHGADAGQSMNVPTTDITDAASKFRSSGSWPLDSASYGAVYAPNLQTFISLSYSKDTEVDIDGAKGKLSDLPATKNQLYNRALAAIDQIPNNLPPSGAIAGIYAAVDNKRGVWKAPGNVSIADVIQPTIPISNQIQSTLNVDPTAGLSINAIRAFTGKGTLVWGARTLAGNDNEWRYINVRRFCIFVEESISKATMQFVFEPNDANTWVKVKGMIENFLNVQWRQGALMGTKAADAYVVSVGLGVTMTAIDVLEGRMIVTVGLCPVRPAEFIILQFVQLMPTS